VRRVLAAGAVAVQFGTAFLLADEAARNRSTVTRLPTRNSPKPRSPGAFTKRFARGIRNRFMAAHEDAAVFGFPEVGQLTGPIRAASVIGADPHATSLWADTGFRLAKPAPAAQIVKALALA
jgi:nitronate monooxygenase